MDEQNNLSALLEHRIPSSLIDIFRQQAEQKISAEGWDQQGRNVQTKIDNFVHCWITEEAFKQILIQHKVWFRYRGLYFGDAQGAGADFILKIDGKEVSVGLRSVAPESLTKWKTVAYPDDRFRTEQDQIADYHIVCNHDNGLTKFFGAITKSNLLSALENSKQLYSARNQERFRVIPLEQFTLNQLQELIEKAEKI